MKASSEYSPLDLPLLDIPAYSHLSRRTQNCLAFAEVWTVGDLLAKSADDLMSIRHFGVKCLAEVEGFLEAHFPDSERIEYFGDSDTDPTEFRDIPRPENFEDLLSLLVDHAFVRRRLAKWAVPYIDLALDTIERCWSKVEQQLEQGMLDDRAPMDWIALQNLSRALSPPAYALPDLLFRLQYLVCTGKLFRLDAIANLDKALNIPTLDAEITQLLDRLDERDLYVLRERFRAEPRTLAELSEEFSVTRQTIRNWEARAVMRLRRGYTELPLPRMRTSMLRSRTCSTFSSEEISRKLHDEGLLHDNSIVRDFLLAWRAIQPDAHPFPEEVISFTKTGLTPLQQKLSRDVKATARRRLRTVGAISLHEIVADLKHPQCSEEDVAAILSRTGLHELVPGYWGTTGRSYAVHRAAEKMIKACGPLHIEHIHIGVLRHQQRQGYAVPPPNVLRAVLVRHEDFYVDDTGVVHLHDLTRGALPNPAEYAWLDAVTSRGPVIHATTMYRFLDKNRVNNGWMTYLTKYSELVQPLGDGLYCLPGTRYTEEDIEAGHRQASKKWIARYGPGG